MVFEQKKGFQKVFEKEVGYIEEEESYLFIGLYQNMDRNGTYS